MRKIFAVFTIFAVSLTLAGCFNPLASVPNPVSPASLYDIKAAYQIAATGADAYIQRYRDGHRCTRTALESVTNLCSRRSIVLKMQDADRKAQIAIGKADAFIRDNPTIDASTVLSAAQLAVTALYSIQQGTQ